MISRYRKGSCQGSATPQRPPLPGLGVIGRQGHLFVVAYLAPILVISLLQYRVDGVEDIRRTAGHELIKEEVALKPYFGDPLSGKMIGERLNEALVRPVGPEKRSRNLRRERARANSGGRPDSL